MDDLKLGATGRFPEGKLNETDQGELRVGIAEKHGKVIINFGKPVAWVALTKEQVRGFIEVLQKHI
jgi:hypothetical protein